MAVIPVIRGKENLFKHFKATKHAHWKLYNALDTKSPIAIQINSNKIPESLGILTDLIEVLDPNGVYILDTFIASGTNDKGYIKPETTMPFTLVEAQPETRPQQPINGTQQQTAGYTPEFGEHIKLIKENAQLKAEYDFSSAKLKEAYETIARLENELRTTIAELEAAEAEEEEDEEEDEEAGLLGKMPLSIQDSIAKLISDKGGLVIENMFSKNLLKKDPEIAISGTPEEEQLLKVVMELKKHDPELVKHLQKLLLVAQQMPDMFKQILSQLDLLGT